MNRKGFTIVELVIVIAVIAILAAVLIPTFTTVIENANQSSALQAASSAYTEAMAEVADDYFKGTVTVENFEFTFNGDASATIKYVGNNSNLLRYTYETVGSTNEIKITPVLK